MIDLYYFPTPNTWKASIMLEECGLPYRVKLVDITRGEQADPAFQAISPNGRVPAIVDHLPEGPQAVFESGAILVYLAEKTGRFLPPSGPARTEALQWLFWQMGGLGPMAGQAGYFRRYHAEGNAFSVARYTNEVHRLYGVLDRRLADRQWIAGDYGVADMACWGWIWFHPLHGQSLDDFPALRRWYFAMAERPAVQRGRQVALDLVSDTVRKIYQGPYYQLGEDFGAAETEVPTLK